ncbi:type VII secretion protein EsaA [Fictibacillus aquaticus]|uniref:Type VII secretion protein EsaA n=1 Tax=Fictibacillus aquaticus TaxID=2021314 RepID=A0A235F5T9_9BACL|nr:type VII secretion protein EsaA [Fictibacillus aquaticus]OYD56544.1 type VII secretion protein EsaA [Fictibacillus aquaticus]
MTGQWSYTIKMILAAAVILVFPHLFIQFVGDNPMEVKETATRSIAIVNEDAGAPEAENLKLSEKVPALLKEQSDFKWTVLGRSAAVNGLKNNEYDAVVFIPSDFTNNLLTYDDQQPAKADFQYKVQSQLNAVNKEKVLRELDYAANRVNTKMSSLYWNYVSEDMDSVRKEFDRILEKEIDFQTVMVNFYKPSSKNLAGELERQKSLLEDLKASMQQGVESSPERASSVEQFEQNLAAFVKYVEAYKEYQNAQQELLGVAQQESILAIQTGSQSYALQQEESRQVFNEQGDRFTDTMAGIETLMQENSDSVTALNETRLAQVDRQIKEMKEIQGRYLDVYRTQQEQVQLTAIENEMLSLRKKVEDSSPGEEKPPGDPKDPKEPAQPGEPGDQGGDKPGFSDELQKLQDMKAGIDGVLPHLKAVSEPTQELLNSITYLEGLTGEEGEIQKLINSISAKENDDKWKQEYDALKALYDGLFEENGKLVEEYNALLAEHTDLLAELDSLKGSSKNLFMQIRGKESSILNSSVLSEARKTMLDAAFSTPLENKSLDTILDYYGALAQYEWTLTRMSNDDPVKETVLNDEILNGRVTETLSVNENEQSQWDGLMQKELPETQQVMNTLNMDFSQFTTDYNVSLESQQAAIMDDIGLMEESANTVLSQLQELQSEMNAPAPSQNADGTAVISNQQSIGQEMMYINELMNTLGDRQNFVVNYTGELQKKVTVVQSDADVLNEKWATNVASTKLVRDDVHNVLGNTVVDGQNNGYVYDYLANPLKISGDTPAEKTKTVPPVVILVIVLISALLIGFFSHYFSNLPLLVKGSLFALLNLIVGLVISLFGLEIYSLSDSRAIQWSIFTILLLTAASLLVKTAFYLGNAAGWIASVGLVLFFVSPLLALAAPNFLYEDPMSAIYMSIQYDADNQFAQGSFVLIGIIAVLSVIPFAADAWRKPGKPQESDQAYEAY